MAGPLPPASSFELGFNFVDLSYANKHLTAPFATPDNKMVEAMLADLMNTVLKGQRFKFHKTDPTTGKRDTVEIGG